MAFVLCRIIRRQRKSTPSANQAAQETSVEESRHVIEVRLEQYVLFYAVLVTKLKNFEHLGHFLRRLHKPRSNQNTGTSHRTSSMHQKAPHRLVRRPRWTKKAECGAMKIGASMDVMTVLSISPSRIHRTTAFLSRISGMSISTHLVWKTIARSRFQ